MGAGKTTVGARVAETVGAGFRDLDRMVVEAAGQSIAALFASEGEAGFRRREARLLPAALAPGGVLALGGGTPMDDGCWRLIRQRATTVWLDAPLEVLRARVAGDAGRPLLAAASAADLERLYATRRARYAESDFRIDASRAIGRVVEDVISAWSR
jgi:shikimate kinase